MEINMKFIMMALLLISITVFAGCVGGGKTKTAPEQVTLSGAVKVDGSSTVYPITEAVSEEFQKLYPKVRVTVGISGTGGGFKKFCNGETDISDASRPIKQREIDACTAKGIYFIEIPVAFDGLSVMVNPANDWIGEGMTVAELREIWKQDSTITKWSDVRAEWPNEKIFLVGADADSGTFDYFTKAIVGKERSSRADYTASADDNVLVQAIAGEKYALGYFGYAYYVENPDKLKLVAIDDDNGKGFIKPTPETISKGTYQPLARPIFIYVNKNSADRPEVKEFIRYYLTDGRALVTQVGYVRLPDKAYELGLKRFEDRKTGSIFSGGSQVGVSIEELLAKE
jgi:phosphate transport system substrate-binding protein